MKKSITKQDIIENENLDYSIVSMKKEIKDKKSQIRSLEGEIDIYQQEINFLVRKRKERQYQMRN